MPVHLQVDGPHGCTRVALDRPMVVGQSPGCECPLDDAQLSRRHLRLVPHGSNVLVTDLDSTNGTRLNGRPIRTAVLRKGDVVEAGGTTLRCEQEPAAAGYDGAQDPSATRVFSPPLAFPVSGRATEDVDPPVTILERARALAGDATAALRLQSTRFSSGRHYAGTWRRRALAAWVLVSMAAMAGPVWSARSTAREAVTVADLSAAWLASEAAHAANITAFERAIRTVAAQQPLARVRLLDGHCKVLMAATYDDALPEGTRCRDGIPERTPRVGHARVGIAPVERPAMSEAAWVVTTVAVPSHRLYALLGLTGGVALLLGAIVWRLTGYA